MNFRSHLNLSHGIKGSNLVAQYGKLVDVNQYQEANHAEEFNSESDIIIKSFPEAGVPFIGYVYIIAIIYFFLICSTI